jgi:hypothetical protein
MLRIRLFPGHDEGLHDHYDPGGDSIDITEIPLHQYIDWESLLNELNAEHIPGWYQNGKRMGSSIVEGKAHVIATNRPHHDDGTPRELSSSTIAIGSCLVY